MTSPLLHCPPFTFLWNPLSTIFCRQGRDTTLEFCSEKIKIDVTQNFEPFFGFFTSAPRTRRFTGLPTVAPSRLSSPLLPSASSPFLTPSRKLPSLHCVFLFVFIFVFVCFCLFVFSLLLLLLLLLSSFSLLTDSPLSLPEWQVQHDSLLFCAHLLHGFFLLGAL